MSRWVIGFCYCYLGIVSITLINAVNAKDIGAEVDAPELSARGNYAVGVKVFELVNPKQIDVLKLGAMQSEVPLTDRKLAIQLWYPASEKGVKQEASYYPAKFSPSIAGDKAKQLNYRVPGYAISDAQPFVEGKFPLVVISHGFNGDLSMMSYLAENLASKGYVVAAIDHYDFDASLQIPQQLWFASALMNRAQDQAFVIDNLPTWLKQNQIKLSSIVDHESVALIGYSMGGFGMMSLLGAGLDENSQTYQLIPNKMLSFLLDKNEQLQSLRREKIKVAIGMAPWGAQKPFRSWSPEALAKVDTPLLLIAGDRDDISQYEDGVKWLFDRLSQSDRYLLVYQNARHNIGGNPAPAEAADNYRLMEFFNEPVWRKERIVDINKHFVTAFLDWHLKGEQSKQAYFKVEHPKAEEGVWPVALTDKTIRYSGGSEDDSNSYWKGFLRRTALGLELYHQMPSKTSLPMEKSEQVGR